MYRAALRSAPRIASPLRRLCAAPSGRRFASTSSAGPKRGWKSSTVRWALATGAVYYYSTSAVFAEEPQLENIRPPPEFSDEDLPTVEAVIAQKRREAEARLQKAASASPKSETATFASQTSAETPVKEIDANGQGLVDIDGTEQRSPEEGSPEALEEEAAQQGAFNPVTGEINWECPCLGGMAHGPCGDEFKAAFSCFVYSQEEPKGMDCIDKFQHMQDCFRLHPEVYSEELADGDDATTDGATEGAASGVVSARDGSAEGVSEDHAVAESSSDKDVAKLDVKKIETETKPEDEENAATVPPPEEKNPTRNSTTAE
ncbi:hypothetical protein GGS21DRAFT_503900 [Xylaria nigripes]|nr:hypothetical protein GGS21DRAFT_503900 [Xylaria nigripes]